MVEQSKHLGTWIRTPKLAPLPFHQGFSIDHGGNLISTWHLDFGMPDERLPIGAARRARRRGDGTWSRCPVEDLAGLLAKVEIPERLELRHSSPGHDAGAFLSVDGHACR